MRTGRCLRYVEAQKAIEIKETASASSHLSQKQQLQAKIRLDFMKEEIRKAEEQLEKPPRLELQVTK